MKCMHDIIRAGIVALGGDGLANYECGCGLEDLMPCGDFMPDCYLAKKCGDEWVVIE